jgi:8-oxo-dGTP pyrophosphatase MutT (NUDIX family)
MEGRGTLHDGESLAMKHYHLQKDDHGHIVELRHPHTPSALATWSDPKERATATPGCRLPDDEHRFAPWTDAPTDNAGWERLAAAHPFDDPPFAAEPGTKAASGAVVVERDGRVWVVSPSNAFGGYESTFPKGTLHAGDGLSMRANALKEVFEEAGLAIELGPFLVDTRRVLTTTRYYLARRIGGCPSTMGWESQAVHLVPRAELAQVAPHPNDRPVLEALDRALPPVSGENPA